MEAKESCETPARRKFLRIPVKMELVSLRFVGELPRVA